MSNEVTETPRGASELTEMIAIAVVPGTAVTAVFAAVAITLAAAIYGVCRRRRRPRARETMFVGRWGDVGPELYLVGRRVRRLSGDRKRDAGASQATPPAASLSFARRILAEVMWCRPAAQLARAFASARLEPFPPDGFVLSESDVEAWLDARRDSIGPPDSGDATRAA